MTVGMELEYMEQFLGIGGVSEDSACQVGSPCATIM